MATANIKTETVETHTVVLELSIDEALVVKALTGMVGGYSAQRDATDGVYNAVSEALSRIGVTRSLRVTTMSRGEHTLSSSTGSKTSNTGGVRLPSV